MTKITVDAAEAARIVRDDGLGQPFLTLDEAARAFLALDKSEQAEAVIKTAGGRTFRADEVGRLYRR